MNGMRKKSQPAQINGMIMLIAVIANAVVLENGITVGGKWYWGLVVTLPLLAAGFFVGQRKTENTNEPSERKDGKLIVRQKVLHGDEVGGKF